MISFQLRIIYFTVKSIKIMNSLLKPVIDINCLCTVEVNNQKESGFFIKVQIEDYIFINGLITTYHLFNNCNNNNEKSFTIYMNGSNISKTVNLNRNNKIFIFFSELLDIFFIEINNTFKEELKPKFLSCICKKNKENPLIYTIVDFSEAKVLLNQIINIDIWGFYYSYTFSTFFGFFGTPLLNENLEVVGVIVSRDFEKNEIFATNFEVIKYAIITLYNQFKTNNENSIKTKNLSINEIIELKNLVKIRHVLHGLKQTSSPNVFKSPETQYFSSLLFYRTKHAWYWSPSLTSDYSINSIKKLNWSIIRTNNNDNTALGGKYNGIKPHPNNVVVIEKLRNSKLKYLI